MANLADKTLAFVGVTGRWAAQYGDVHRLPWLPASQPLVGNDDRVPGVFVHAYRRASARPPGGVLEVSKGWALLAALIAGVLPMLVCAFVDVRLRSLPPAEMKLPIGARSRGGRSSGLLSRADLAGCAVVDRHTKRRRSSTRDHGGRDADGIRGVSARPRALRASQAIRRRRRTRRTDSGPFTLGPSRQAAQAGRRSSAAETRWGCPPFQSNPHALL